MPVDSLFATIVCACRGVGRAGDPLARYPLRGGVSGVVFPAIVPVRLPVVTSRWRWRRRQNPRATGESVDWGTCARQSPERCTRFPDKTGPPISPAVVGCQSLTTGRPSLGRIARTSSDRGCPTLRADRPASRPARDRGGCCRRCRPHQRQHTRPDRRGQVGPCREHRRQLGIGGGFGGRFRCRIAGRIAGGRATPLCNPCIYRGFRAMLSASQAECRRFESGCPLA